MSLIFDGIILLVAVIAIAMGAKRGFVKSVMGIFILIAALFLAYAFTPTVSPYIEETAFIESISEGISETISSLAKNGEDSFDLVKLFRDMPESFQTILERYGVSADALEQAINPQPNANGERVQALADMIAGPVAKAISGVLAFLLIFIVSLILLKILMWVLDLIFHLPVLKTANTVLGLVVGIISALVWAWVLSALSVIFINAMSSISPGVFDPTIIENTVILKFFANDGLATLFRMVTG